MSAEASSVAQSQLDLYDFFSVLLPGVYLLIILIPVVPNALSFGTTTGAVVLIVGGYVVGRALHTAAESLDHYFNAPSNRDTFVNAITTREEGDDSSDDNGDDDQSMGVFKLLWERFYPNGDIESLEFNIRFDGGEAGVEILNDELKDNFYREMKQDSDLRLPYHRADADERDIEAVYVYTRSKLYQHGNVRSQSFQAIYSFYRSAFLATQLGGIVYLIYAFGQSREYWAEIGNYSTLIGELDPSVGTVIVAAELLLILGLDTLGKAKADYRKYYIEYLVVDYLTIR